MCIPAQQGKKSQSCGKYERALESFKKGNCSQAYTFCRRGEYRIRGL